MGDSFDVNGITYERKGIYDNFICLRSKAYVLEDSTKQAKEDFHVHHALWIKEPDKIKEILLRGLKEPYVFYHTKSPVKLRQAYIRNLPFGMFEEQDRIFWTEWDNKRELLPDNTTRPWNNVNEYQKAENKSFWNKKKLQ